MYGVQKSAREIGRERLLTGYSQAKIFPAMKGLCIPYWWRASKNGHLFNKERRASKWFRVMHGRRHHDGAVTGTSHRMDLSCMCGLF